MAVPEWFPSNSPELPPCVADTESQGPAETTRGCAGDTVRTATQQPVELPCFDTPWNEDSAWNSDASTAASASRATDTTTLSGGVGAVALQSCEALLKTSAAVLRTCGSFFNPVLLAQLDSALAHELARQAGSRAAEAGEAVDLAVKAGNSAEALAHLAGKAASAKGVARKTASQAALAANVITSLGGAPTPIGWDAEDVKQVSGAVLIDVIASLEEAKNALCAAQGHAQALFVAQQRFHQAQAGVPHHKLGMGIAQQVGLARHESPHRGRQLCELSEVLVREMPCTMKALEVGRISEYRASLIAKETAFLTREDRAQVDERICGDLDAVVLLGTRELCAATKKAAYALAPEAFVKRNEKAVGDRYVSLRPAADGMTFLTALIPLKQGVRVLATLTQIAASTKASGDGRGKGQIMADALMHRLVHHTPCNAGAGAPTDHRGMAANHAAGPSPSPRSRSTENDPEAAVCTAVDQPEISLELVMTDRSLFGSANDPAILVGYDPLPAPLGRQLIFGNNKDNGNGASPRVWLKRLFTHPASNALLAMDSRARLFPEGMKEFLRLQDQRCQTPYCDAPIREYDHIKAYAAGGATTVGNGQGLCAACNQAKEAPGWASERNTGSEHGLPSTQVITPTGHRYISTAPPLPGPHQGKSSGNTIRRC